MLVKITLRLIGILLSFIYRIVYPIKSSYNPLKVTINGLLIINKGKFICKGKFQTRSGCLINIHAGQIILGKNTAISRNCSLNCHQKIEIGDDTIVGEGTKFYDHDHKILGGHTQRIKYETAPIKIGKNTWIGADCLILRGVEIGDNSIIAAGSIITKSIPSNTLCIQKRQTNLSALK